MENEEPGLTVEAALRSRREKLGLSQRELGKRANVSAAYVSAFERGRLVPSLPVFARLAVELRLTRIEIFVLVVNEAIRNRSALSVTEGADNQIDICGSHRNETKASDSQQTAASP